MPDSPTLLRVRPGDANLSCAQDRYGYVTAGYNYTKATDLQQFTFETSLYGSFDSEPGQDADSSSDCGVTTSLGHSF